MEYYHTMPFAITIFLMSKQTATKTYNSYKALAPIMQYDREIPLCSMTVFGDGTNHAHVLSFFLACKNFGSLLHRHLKKNNVIITRFVHNNDMICP